MAKTKKKKAPPPKLLTLIRSALRRISSFHHQPIKDCLAAARVPAPSGMRVKHLYKCAICGNLFPLKEVAVDHKESAGALSSLDDLSEWSKRLFCGVDNLQVLCNDGCHAIKTMCDRYNITWDEAVIRKKVAAFSKLTLDQMKKRLYDEFNCSSPEKTKTGMTRQYTTFLKGE